MTGKSLKGKRIGVTQWTSSDLFDDIVGAMRQVAGLHGVEVGPILNAGGDVVRQVEQAEAFLVDGVDGFVILSATSAWDDLVRRAVEAGIYVFSYNVGPTTGATMNIFKRPGGGAALGEAAAGWINEQHGGEAEFATLVFKTAPSLAGRSDAMRDAVLAGAPQARLVAEITAPARSDAVDSVANLLRARPNLKAIVCWNDETALGAYAAAREAGKSDPGQLWIGGFDGTLPALDRIAERGIYQATVSFLVRFSAVQLMRDMIKCLRGERVPPTREIAFQLVTAVNVEAHRELIADPLAPEVQHVYDEIIVYSEEPLTTAAGYRA